VIRFPGKGGLQKVEILPCPTYRSTGQDSCRRPAKIIVAEQFFQPRVEAAEQGIVVNKSVLAIFEETHQEEMR
jgi:hypothetical protein